MPPNRPSGRLPWQPGNGEKTGKHKGGSGQYGKRPVQGLFGQTHLIQRFNDLIGTAGLVGEENNRVFLLCTAVSYGMPDTLHTLIQGSSGSGKTHLLVKISSFIPDEDVKSSTRVTESSFYNYGMYVLKNSLIVQKDDYYPFGMSFNSYMRPSSLGQKYLYNGKERQELTGWYDFHARQYDSALGRWFAVDPDGRVVFLIPHISFSNGGLDVGLTVGVGVPGALSAQLIVGHSFGNGGNTYATLSASAGGVSAYELERTVGSMLGWDLALDLRGFPLTLLL